ncbi:hypothetical protein WN990_01675 [Kitasatospora purpeofusca]|uniref:hypothetical protein n=1 Tax=Kitasatospora purpeofusca TaxID=67352 RepID=UPI0030F01C15
MAQLIRHETSDVTTLMAANSSTPVDVFLACYEAMQRAVLIKRVSKSDKEFHFQNWVGDRLTDAGLMHDSIGRNSYPDFTLVNHPEGYEVKGLQWPGREADYDSNSRVPTGLHNGRTVFYVFGRYPANSDDVEYPVVDLVICHGDFLNADHTYIHKNKSFRGFGSYGDLLVRDRKMYVAPTPFALTEGTTGQATLIIPADLAMDERLEKVGDLVRVEARDIIVGYSFDMRKNVLTPETAPNPTAGDEHHFAAYRMKGAGSGVVRMKNPAQLNDQLLLGGDE